MISNLYWNIFSPVYSEIINHTLRRKLYKKATEVSPRDELMTRNGKYAEMFNLQAEKYVGCQASVAD